MNRTLKIALLWGVWNIALMLLIYYFDEGEITSRILIKTLVSGTIGGVLFAIVIQFFATRLLKRVVIDLEEDEKLIREAGANHFKGVEGVGGKLVLTSKRVIFKSHGLNIQNHQTVFEFARIDNVQKTKTLNILDNGLLIAMGDEQHRFVVEGPGEWVQAIEGQRTLAGPA